MDKHCFNAPSGPPAVGPYSHCVIANGFLFVSGQIALAPDGSGPRTGSFEEEARTALDNLKTILEEAGSGLGHVVKTTIYLADMARFKEFNAIYGEYFTIDPPARTCIQVGALPLDLQVEIEAIAVKPERNG